MKSKRFEWAPPRELAMKIRQWAGAESDPVDVGPIRTRVEEGGDAAILGLTAQFDATAQIAESLRVDPQEAQRALADLDPTLREAFEVAATNIEAVAEAQVDDSPHSVRLPQGQTVEVREVPVGAAGIYAPGGRAAYPSSVLMSAIPARVAGVSRIALASPPGIDGRVHPVVLAAAALCGVTEIYAMGGAQSIFGLALGTETIEPVDVIAGPGNSWVQEAKRSVAGLVGIDSFAGPSELMVVFEAGANIGWIGLDLCAQAEHGPDGLLVAVCTDGDDLGRLETEVERLAKSRDTVSDSPFALVEAPGVSEAIALSEAIAPEHLELVGSAFESRSDTITTAGCVFIGATAATAFGDYAAGSNHVLPTGGSGRFSGPLGPGTFRRRISNVNLPESAARALAPHVDAIARAEGFPVHGESTTVRKAN